MGWNDHFVADAFTRIEVCPFCDMKFECEYEEQQPGFRFEEEKICPHCHKVIAKSMNYDFHTRKIL